MWAEALFFIFFSKHFPDNINPLNPPVYGLILFATLRKELSLGAVGREDAGCSGGNCRGGMFDIDVPFKRWIDEVNEGLSRIMVETHVVEDDSGVLVEFLEFVGVCNPEELSGTDCSCEFGFSCSTGTRKYKGLEFGSPSPHCIQSRFSEVINAESRIF